MITFFTDGPSINFPITAFSGGLTLSARIRRLTNTRFIWTVNRMLIITSTESTMIFFMALLMLYTSLSPAFITKRSSAPRCQCAKQTSSLSRFIAHFHLLRFTPLDRLFQYFAGLARPQKQVEMVHIDADILGEPFKPFFYREVPRASCGTHSFADHTHLAQAVQYVLVQDRIAGKPDVPEKVACLFVSQTFDRSILSEKITAQVPAV